MFPPLSEYREYMYHWILSSESCPLLPATFFSHSRVAEWKLWSDCREWKPQLLLFWLVDYCPDTLPKSGDGSWRHGSPLCSLGDCRAAPELQEGAGLVLGCSVVCRLWLAAVTHVCVHKPRHEPQHWASVPAGHFLLHQAGTVQ